METPKVSPLFGRAPIELNRAYRALCGLEKLIGEENDITNLRDLVGEIDALLNLIESHLATIGRRALPFVN